MERKRIIGIISAVLVLMLVLTGCKWMGKNPDDTSVTTEDAGPLSPDYPLPPVDTGAETIEGEDTEKLDNPEGGGSSVGLMYMVEAEIDISKGYITLMFGNPSRSNQNMILSVSVQGRVIAQSGLLVPGSKITQLSLNEEGQTKLTEKGIYEGKFIVDNYDPLSGEKAIVNIEIPITITVK